MADNVQAETVVSAGSRFVTAEISFSGDTAHAPGSFFGILSGSEGSWTYTLITGGAGAVSAGTPRVTLASDDPAVAKLGTIDADTSALFGCVGGTELQVDIVGALPAGTNAIGKLAANSGVDIGDVDVTSVSGNVTVVQATASSLNATVVGTGTFAVQASCTNAGTFAVQAACTNAGTFAVQVDGNALTSLQLIDDVIATLGTTTYTEASTKGAIIAAVRRDADTTLVDTTNEVGPLQMNAAGQLKVEVFSGETLPVSLTSTTVTGTVAVTQSGTWDEVGINDSGNSITVDAPVGTPVFVRLSDGSSAITTLPVSLASVPSHAVTNAGTFAVQVDGNALTALQLIDDVVFADDAAFTLGTSKGVMAMGFAGTQSVDANDACALACTTAGALRVNVENASLTVASHAVTNAGTFAVQVDGSALTALQLIDDPVLTDDAAFTPATSKVMMSGFEADETATDSVDEGDAGAARMTLDRKQIVTMQPHTAGGCTPFYNLDVDETEDAIKASAGQLYELYLFNTTNAIIYVKLYNATTANVTVGSTTPLMTIPVPGNNDTDGAGVVRNWPNGLTFDTAITIAATTSFADADTGAPGTNALIASGAYK